MSLTTLRLWQMVWSPTEFRICRQRELMLHSLKITLTLLRAAFKWEILFTYWLQICRRSRWKMSNVQVINNLLSMKFSQVHQMSKPASKTARISQWHSSRARLPGLGSSQHQEAWEDSMRCCTCCLIREWSYRASRHTYTPTSLGLSLFTWITYHIWAKSTLQSTWATRTPRISWLRSFTWLIQSSKRLIW